MSARHLVSRLAKHLAQLEIKFAETKSNFGRIKEYGLSIEDLRQPGLAI